MRVILLFGLWVGSVAQAHVWVTQCVSDDSQVEFTNNKGYQTLKIVPNRVHEGENYLASLEDLNVTWNSKSDSCEQIDGAAVIQYRYETQFSARLRFEVDGRTFSKTMFCEKSAFGSSQGGGELCSELSESVDLFAPSEP